tara:strand:- start:90 stop:737 length:648 start_codon:yes stop_codon:yes gene_type:complete
MPSMPSQCDWEATSGFELVLATGLSERDDRPARIPLPANSTVAIKRYIGQDSIPIKLDGFPQPTVWLNNQCSSKYKNVLSRAHAELRVEDCMLCINDGKPRQQLASTNGTAVDGKLVPLGGKLMVSTGCSILFGVPDLIPFNPDSRRGYQKLKSPEFRYIFKRISKVSAPPPSMRASLRVAKRLTRSQVQPIAKRTRSSLRKNQHRYGRFKLVAT